MPGNADDEKKRPLVSVEAEQAILGCLISHNAALERVADLAPSDFVTPEHRKLFEVVTTLIRAGRAATPTVLLTYLPTGFQVVGVPIEDYFRTLLASATTIMNVHEYGRVIRNLAIRRDLIAFGERLARDAGSADVDADPQVQIEAIEQQLALLGGSRTNALRVTCVNDVEAKPVVWVWPDRLARGHMTLMVGSPGDGKSQISLDVTARVTMGTAWPDGGRAPQGSVLVLSAEDSVGDVIRPRLEAAGADLKRVHVIEAVRDRDGRERTFDLAADLASLKRLVRQLNDVAVVIVDPITSYMGTKIDSHRTTDVRSVLEPLQRFADEVGVAVLAISHPPKAAQGKAINAATGSLAFVAAARLFFLTATEPETERRLLLPVKNNLGPKAGGIGYRIDQSKVSKGIIAPHVIWDDAPVTMTADDAMRSGDSSEGSETIPEAIEFLIDLLTAGPLPAKKVIGTAKESGISERALRAAGKKLGIKPKKSGFDGGNWVWELPPDSNVVPFPKGADRR